MIQRQAQEAHRQQQLQEQMLQRQAQEAQEAHHQQQLQEQMLQRQAQEAQEAHHQQQLQEQMLQRQAQEAHRQQQLQEQMLQRQAQEAQEAHHQQQLQEQMLQRQAQEAHHQQQHLHEQELHHQLELQLQQQVHQQLQHHEAQEMHRQALDLQANEQDVLHEQAEEARHDDVAQEVQERHLQAEQRRLQYEARMEDAWQDYHNPGSEEHHDQDEERRRAQQHEHRQQDNPEHEQPPPQNIPIPIPVQPPPQNVPVPLGGQPYTEPVNHHTLGPLTVQCPNCHARHFASEKLTKSSARAPRFGMCCLQGQVVLPPLLPWPPELQQLYQQRAFVTNIRQYNSTVAFTLVGVKVDDHAVQGSGPSTFRIHGSLHHLMGSLMPGEDQQPAYAQLYVFDAEHATDVRVNRNRNLDPRILRELHDMLHRRHPYAQLYKAAYQVMVEKPPEQHRDVQVRIHFQPGTDGRRYNVPTANEIAAIIPGDGSEEVSDKRDIILRLQGGQLCRISQLSHAYSTLHYVLLFPFGEEGWHLDIPMNVNQGAPGRAKKVTQLLYYAYRLHIRPAAIEPDNIFRAGRLFQQYVVDAWATIEQSNLNWIRNNQKRLRADCYRGLTDNVLNDGIDDLAETGRSIILPSSHSGGPCYMHQLLQDSLAICRACKKPDLFLTMTANGSWPEITENLLPGEFASFALLMF